MAKLVASWSKDPSTQVGAVAVRNRTVIAQGYNGFPRGCDDHELYYLNKAIKYKRIVHAEMNAIYNACRTGVSLKGSTAYIHGLPCCHECAKAIIQVGIKTVVFRSKIDDNKPINIKIIVVIRPFTNCSIWKELVPNIKCLENSIIPTIGLKLRI